MFWSTPEHRRFFHGEQGRTDDQHSQPHERHLFVLDVLTPESGRAIGALLLAWAPPLTAQDRDSSEATALMRRVTPSAFSMPSSSVRTRYRVVPRAAACPLDWA